MYSSYGKSTILQHRRKSIDANIFSYSYWQFSYNDIIIDEFSMIPDIIPPPSPSLKLSMFYSFAQFLWSAATIFARKWKNNATQ
jgi:hypothetical protein